MEVESGGESADTCSDNENVASSHVGDNSYGVVDISPTVSIESRTAQKPGMGFRSFRMQPKDYLRLWLRDDTDIRFG